MGFLSGMFSSAVKIVITPVAILKDVANVATGQEVDATKSLVESAGEDVKEAVDNLADGEIL